MRKLFIVVLVLAAGFIGSAAMGEILLFNGDPISRTGISLVGWGSGSIVEATDHLYVHSRCVKIRSEGLHEGGCIAFKDPIDILSEAFDDNTYLQFVVLFSTIDREGTGIGGSPGFGIHTISGIGTYVSDGQEFRVPARPKVKYLRVVLESSEGGRIEANQSVPVYDDEGWYKIAIPFKTMGFKSGDSFHVSRIIISTDYPDTIFIGQIGTIVDDTQITCNAGDDQVIAVNDLVTFRAQAEGGISQLEYYWNFGDRNRPNDPEAYDATGEIVNHRYTKGGEYTVKLMVKDKAGIKKPAVSTVQIVVND